MPTELHLFTLAATLLLPAAAIAAPPAAPIGYFDTADAPLVGPTEFDTGDAAATLARQQASGYFPSAGAPLVVPTAPGAADPAETLAKQRASGYFPTADAPLVTPSVTAH